MAEKHHRKKKPKTPRAQQRTDQRTRRAEGKPEILKKEITYQAGERVLVIREGGTTTWIGFGRGGRDDAVAMLGFVEAFVVPELIAEGVKTAFAAQSAGPQVHRVTRRAPPP